MERKNKKPHQTCGCVVETWWMLQDAVGRICLKHFCLPEMLVLQKRQITTNHINTWSCQTTTNVTENHPENTQQQKETCGQKKDASASSELLHTLRTTTKSQNIWSKSCKFLRNKMLKIGSPRKIGIRGGWVSDLPKIANVSLRQHKNLHSALETVTLESLSEIRTWHPSCQQDPHCKWQRSPATQSISQRALCQPNKTHVPWDL